MYAGAGRNGSYVSKCCTFVPRAKGGGKQGMRSVCFNAVTAPDPIKPGWLWAPLKAAEVTVKGSCGGLTPGSKTSGTEEKTMRFQKQEGVCMKGSHSHTRGSRPPAGSAEAGRGETQTGGVWACTLQAGAEAGWGPRHRPGVWLRSGHVHAGGEHPRKVSPPTAFAEVRQMDRNTAGGIA